MSTQPQTGTTDLVPKKNLNEILESTRKVEIIDLPIVADRFKKLYLTFHGKDAEKFYEAERFHVMKILNESDALRNCSALSLYGCILDLCVNGISLDPMLKQAYLVPKGGKATLRISGYGELAIRKDEGQIKYVDNPVLVFEGDHFLTGTTLQGSRFVEHKQTIPRTSDKAVACFIKITRSDGTTDFSVLTREDFELLRKQSERPDGPAYSKNYNGMFMTKTIKHAFKGYERPRSLSRAKFSELETQDEIDGPDIYGFTDADVTPGSTEKKPDTVQGAQPAASQAPPPGGPVDPGPAAGEDLSDVPY